MSLTPDGRRRMMSDFEKEFKYSPAHADKVPDFLAKVEAVVERVKQHVKTICKAGGAVKPSDREALRATVFTMLLQEFDSFSKDELHCFSTTIVADHIMADVEASPWGSDKPDLLS